MTISANQGLETGDVLRGDDGRLYRIQYIAANPTVFIERLIGDDTIFPEDEDEGRELFQHIELASKDADKFSLLRAVTP